MSNVGIIVLIHSRCTIIMYTRDLNMWCDIGKSVWSRTCNIFSFLLDWNAHQEKYILLKTPNSGSKLQRLKDSLNNRKRKKYIPFSGCISQSMLPTDSARSQHIYFGSWHYFYRNYPPVHKSWSDLVVWTCGHKNGTKIWIANKWTVTSVQMILQCNTILMSCEIFQNVTVWGQYCLHLAIVK